MIVVFNLQILRMYIRIYSELYYRGDITYYMQEVQQENALAASLQPLETQVAALATSVTAMQTQFGATDPSLVLCADPDCDYVNPDCGIVE